MIILSLFDGISCGRVALERAGIPITQYYASEIDKYAIQISKKNYSDIIHLGDINNWNNHYSNEHSWNLEKPDLIIGGSPCQGFSFAGKQLAFDDPRSALFFKFVEVLEYYKPKYFLLENVRMKKEHLQVITDALGVEPICINSALVSAQNRVRYYWTNIPNVIQPEDKGIVLKDIIEHGVCDRDKSFCIDANYWKGGDLKQYFEKHRRQLIFSKNYVQWDQNGKGYKSQDQRAFYLNNKHGTLPSNNGQSKCKVLLDKQYKQDEFLIRKLTPIECERLQTLPDNYTEGVSSSQRYKMLGNGWTVDVLAHIFKEML